MADTDTQTKDPAKDAAKGWAAMHYGADQPPTNVPLPATASAYIPGPADFTNPISSHTGLQYGADQPPTPMPGAFPGSAQQPQNTTPPASALPTIPQNWSTPPTNKIAPLDLVSGTQPSVSDQPADVGGSPTPINVQSGSQPFVPPKEDIAKSDVGTPPITYEESQTIDPFKLGPVLLNSDAVPRDDAVNMLANRGEQLRNSNLDDHGAYLFMSDLGDLLSKIPKSPIEDPIGFLQGTGGNIKKWIGDAWGLLNQYGGGAQTFFTGMGEQPTKPYYQDIDRQHKQGLLTDDEYQTAKTLLGQVDQWKAKQAALSGGISATGLGEIGTSATDSYDSLNQQITAALYHADPDLAKSQGIKALYETATGMEVNLEQTKKLLGGNDFDLGKYVSGLPVWATITDRDKLGQYVDAQRANRSASSLVAHQAGNVDHATETYMRWYQRYQKANGIVAPYAEDTPNLALKTGYRADPQNIENVNQLSKLVTTEMVTRGLPFDQAMDSAVNTFFKLGGGTYNKVALPLVKTLTGPSARKLAGVAELIAHGASLLHGDPSHLMTDMIWDAGQWGVNYAANKWGAIGGDIFKAAANKSYNGRGYVWQTAARVPRVAAESVAQSIPAALMYSEGDPDKLVDNLPTFAGLHMAMRTPGLGLDILRGGGGDQLWVDPQTGKPVTPIDRSTGKPLVDAKGNPIQRPIPQYHIDNAHEFDANNITNLNGLDPARRSEAIETMYAASDHTAVFYTQPNEMADLQARFGAHWQKTPFGFFVPGEYTGIPGGKALAVVDVNNIDRAMGHEVVAHGVAWAHGPAAIDRVGEQSIKYNDPDKFIRDNYGSNTPYDQLPDLPNPANPAALSKQMIRREMGVEDIANYWHSGSIAQFYKNKPGLARQLKIEANKFLQEKMGFNPQTWEAKSPMGVQSNFTTAAYIDGLIRQYVQSGRLPPRVINPNSPTEFPAFGETVHDTIARQAQKNAARGGGAGGGAGGGGGGAGGGGAAGGAGGGGGGTGGPGAAGGATTGGATVPPVPPVPPAATTTAPVTTTPPATTTPPVTTPPVTTPPVTPAPVKPTAPPAPTVPDESVIKGLMKTGQFTRAQAEAFAAKGTASSYLATTKAQVARNLGAKAQPPEAPTTPGPEGIAQPETGPETLKPQTTASFLAKSKAAAAAKLKPAAQAPPETTPGPEGVAKPEAGPETITQPTEGERVTPAVVGEFGKGLSESMQNMLWEKVQRGETTEGGAPSNLLLTAAAEKAAGRLNTRADFDALYQKYGEHLAGKGAEKTESLLHPQVSAGATGDENPIKTPEQYAAIREAMAKGTPTGEAQAANEGKRPATWEDIQKLIGGEGPAFMPRTEQGPFKDSTEKDVFYHGTTHAFDDFSLAPPDRSTGSPTNRWGTFFTKEPEEAARYATQRHLPGGSIIPTYLDLRNPYEMSYPEFVSHHAYSDLSKGLVGGTMESHYASQVEKADATKQRLIDQGHDGIVIGRESHGPYAEYVVFDPTQIKSKFAGYGQPTGEALTPSFMPGRRLESNRPPYRPPYIASAVTATGAGRKMPAPAPEQFQVPVPTPEAEPGTTAPYQPEKEEVPAPTPTPTPTAKAEPSPAEKGFVPPKEDILTEQPTKAAPKKEVAPAETKAEPFVPPKEDILTKQEAKPGEVSDEFVNQLPRNEGLARAQIVLRLEEQTGEKDIKLNDPRVDTIWKQAQGKAATNAVDEETKLPVKGSAREPVEALEQPKGSPKTERTMRATWFGRNPDGSVDTTDEKTMSYYNAHHGAWGANLLDSRLMGVALSPGFLRANGVDVSKNPSSQGFKARVTAPNGQSRVVDIVDLGPRHTVDMTYGLGKALGLNDNSQLKVELLDKQGHSVTLNDEAEGGGVGGGPSDTGPGPGGGGEGQPAPIVQMQPPPRWGAQPEPEPVAAPRYGGGFEGGGGESGGSGAGTTLMPLGHGGGEPMPESAAMQQAGYFGSYGGGYGLGAPSPMMIPGIAPEAPGISFMPRPMGRGRIGGLTPEGEEGEEEESTIGQPNVRGFEKLKPLLNAGKLKEAQKQHAQLLSPDDPRVKLTQQGNKSYFKGEHFVEGDPVHAAALLDVPPDERRALAAGQTAIANKQPMHMSYASAPPAGESPITRQSREVHYDASSPQGRILGQTNARLAGHSMIPVSLGISQPQYKGDTSHGYIQGISTSVAAHNHHQINQELARMGEQTPYPDINSDKFHVDLSGYVQNLLAGHKGTGRGYQAGTADFPSKPDKKYVPYFMKQREADFMNAIINNTGARYSPKLRELARAGGTLQSEEGEVNPLLHRIDQEHIHDQAIDRAAKHTWRTEMLEPTIRSFHTGLVHALHETPEQIPQEIRPNVPGYRELTGTLGKELGSERGRPDIAAAVNFMPRPPAAEPLSPEEHAELRGNIRKQFISGKLRKADYLERLKDVPEPGEPLEPPQVSYMPMAGQKARGFAQAEQEGRTFETPLPGGGKRFEIDDRDFEFKPASKSKFGQWKTFQTPANALEERYQTDKRGTGTMPLSDAIDHPELFENYPHLRNTEISMDPTIPYAGQYVRPWEDWNNNLRGDHITLKRPDDKETLVHEIQHAVQHYEKFAGQGANTTEVYNAMRQDNGVRNELEKEWNTAWAKEVPFMSKQDRIRNHHDKLDWMKKRLQSMASAMYQMDPGEIEARVAEKRAMHPTEAEREAKFATGFPRYERISPQESILDEMRQTEKYAREAGSIMAYPRGRESGYYKPWAEPPRSEPQGLEPPETAIGFMAKKAKEPAAPREVSKQTLDQLGPRPEGEKGEIWDKFAARLDKQIPGSIPLRPAYNKKGDLKYDKVTGPEFEKEGGGYHLANAPMLGKKALGYDAKGGVAKAPEGTEDTIAPGDLEYLNPTDRLRISYLDKNGAIDKYADALNKEYDRVEKEIPEALKAKDWYNDTERYLKKHFGAHADLVANLLAATSARTGVKTNYGFAMHAYHRYARGDYERHIKLYLQALEMRRAGTLAAHVAQLKNPETGENYHPTSEANAMALYLKHHDILPTQHDINDVTKKGPQYGMHSEKVLKVLAETWLDELEGPKTRRYTGNMTGRTIQSTGDMWVGRQLRRLGFEGHTKEPWLVQAPAESGLSNLDFAIQELAHRRAAEKRGLEPRQHQAILWTSEIKHWLNKGWATGGDPAERDYRPMLEKYERPEWAKRPEVQGYQEGGLVDGDQVYQDPTDNMGATYQDIGTKSKRGVKPPLHYPTIASDPGTMDYYQGWANWLGVDVKDVNFNNPDNVARFNNLINTELQARQNAGKMGTMATRPWPQPQVAPLSQQTRSGKPTNQPPPAPDPTEPPYLDPPKVRDKIYGGTGGTRLQQFDNFARDPTTEAFDRLERLKGFNEAETEPQSYQKGGKVK